MTRVFPPNSIFDTHAPRRTLEQKRAQLTNGETVTMTCREYFRHTLMENGISADAFSAALERNPAYVSRIFNETGPLPQTLVKALTTLTHHRSGFWRQTTFEVKPNEKVPTIDLSLASQLPEGLFETQATPRVTPVHIIASAQTQALIRSLPRIAATMLCDPETYELKRDTFLIDADGNFRTEWHELGGILGRGSANAAFARWCQLPVQGEHTEILSRFVTRLITHAADQGLLPSRELLSYVSAAPTGPVRQR